LLLQAAISDSFTTKMNVESIDVIIFGLRWRYVRGDGIEGIEGNWRNGESKSA
jgi:hypothetical protein